MHDRFRGEVAYNAEVDVHFPHLTVGQTLTFATKLRTPHQRLDNQPRKKAVRILVKILGIVFGLSHTFNTKVGVCSVPQVNLTIERLCQRSQRRRTKTGFNR